MLWRTETGWSRTPARRCWPRRPTGSGSPTRSRGRWRAMRERRGRHDPGRIVRDLAVMLADGGDCLSDLRAVRDQQALFGPVASDATAFRVIDRIASDPALLQRAAGGSRAGARERLGRRRGARADRDRHRRHADHGALGEGGRGGHVQARVRVSPAAGLPGRDARGAGRRAAAGQRRRQHRLRPRRDRRAGARAASARGRRDGRDRGPHRQRRRHARVHRRAARRPHPVPDGL